MEEPAGVWVDPCRQIHLQVRLFYRPAHGVMKRRRDHHRCRHYSLNLKQLKGARVVVSGEGWLGPERLERGGPTKYINTPRLSKCLSRRWNWYHPPPSPASECAPGTKGRGGLHTRSRLRVRGWGSPNSDDWRESLILCLLCSWPYWLLKQRQMGTEKEYIWKGPSLVGSLGSLCWYKRFLSCLDRSSRSRKNKSFYLTLYHFICPSNGALKKYIWNGSFLGWFVGLVGLVGPIQKIFVLPWL